jgi:hypothetical protein
MLLRAMTALALVSLVACTVQKEPEPRFTPAGRIVSPDERLPREAKLSQWERDMGSLTNARCDREVHCNNVGAGRKYENRAQCVAMIDRDGYTDLDAEHCPLGLDQDMLGTCLGAIKNEACGAVLTRIDDLPACADSDMCVR